MAPLPLEQRQARRQLAARAVLMLLYMLVLALIPALRAVAGLERGSTIDLHRDEAFVRALLEGHYGEDPAYLGGGMWYTPLITWLEAAVAWLTGLPASQVIVQLGPFANLLAPISFFTMCWYFVGPVRAVACTAIFLFFSIGQEPGWVVATYSHRLIPVSFSQSFFYLDLILIDHAFRRRRPAPALLAGFLMGITFLAHAGPAIIAVLLVAVLTMWEVSSALLRQDRKAAWSNARTALLAAAAFIVASLPLTWHLLTGNLHVANRAGFLFTYYALSLHGINVFLYHNLALVNLLAAAGIMAVWHNRAWAGGSPYTRKLLFAWAALAMLLFAYSYLASLLQTHYGISLPLLLPSFHFYFYTSAVLSVFAGLAVVEILKWTWTRRGSPGANGYRSEQPGLVFVFFLLVAAACTARYPSYATRRDIAIVRNRDLAFKSDTAGSQAEQAIHRLVPWNGVVLCEPEFSAWPMLATARHVVATESTMGNPYLDHAQRERDNAELLQGMARSLPGTAGLMGKYGVTHLLVSPQELARMPKAVHWFPVRLFQNQQYVLLAR